MPEIRTRLLFLAILLSALPAQAAQSPLRTYANPIDIDYRYNFEQHNQGISYRTGADPVFVRHGDATYLFLTLADGYWRSTDLLHWTFVKPSRWPFESVVAPAAISDRRGVVLMPSMMDQRAVMLLAGCVYEPYGYVRPDGYYGDAYYGSTYYDDGYYASPGYYYDPWYYGYPGFGLGLYYSNRHYHHGGWNHGGWDHGGGHGGWNHGGSDHGGWNHGGGHGGNSHGTHAAPSRPAPSRSVPSSPRTSPRSRN